MGLGTSGLHPPSSALPAPAPIVYYWWGGTGRCFQGSGEQILLLPHHLRKTSPNKEDLDHVYLSCCGLGQGLGAGGVEPPPACCHAVCPGLSRPSLYTNPWRLSHGPSSRPPQSFGLI